MYVPRIVVDASHPPRGSSNDWWAHGHSVPKPTFISELGVRRPYGFNRLHAGQSEGRTLARFQNSVVLRTSQDPGPMLEDRILPRKIISTPYYGAPAEVQLILLRA
ncbi:uncharacterized protein CIMG_03405 [Coccidioides immitis RS]|uniref:Uncharacterized protein n=4 Tax=Coccidioides immitis TaxID=5501 RepID=J3KBA2_COCIM|nr:uncharacterized protein CIMG_03405 [Coccidioides immitis RS]EAS32381.3 hypothetical protein CIMG_03405 [Coccidioides immitis RS]KMP07615.1 hypothetical protein CIRG_07296 [Coccidioides immitis RMSCC 2394]KMU71934.1 hypothetical protein CISG_00243 [Coccidioides immitis RMSCC 3703]KMU82699.1 hypothetical protein CIHG_00481 [Coccidioides immitis H538.4]